MAPAALTPTQNSSLSSGSETERWGAMQFQQLAPWSPTLCAGLRPRLSSHWLCCCRCSVVRIYLECSWRCEHGRRHPTPHSTAGSIPVGSAFHVEVGKLTRLAKLLAPRSRRQPETSHAGRFGILAAPCTGLPSVAASRRVPLPPPLLGADQHEHTAAHSVPKC